jgi:hypothetical protein
LITKPFPIMSPINSDFVCPENCKFVIFFGSIVPCKHFVLHWIDTWFHSHEEMGGDEKDVGWQKKTQPWLMKVWKKWTATHHECKPSWHGTFFLLQNVQLMFSWHMYCPFAKHILICWFYFDGNWFAKPKCRQFIIE